MNDFALGTSRPRRRSVFAALVFAMLLTTAPAAQETLIQKLLRIAGLTAAPSQLRGSGDDASPGDVWMVDTRTGAGRALTSDASPDNGYQSPVFGPDGTVYALKTYTLVKIDLTGRVTVLQRAPGAAKLVGVNQDNADEMVVLLRAATAAPLSVLSLKTGALTPLPFDAASETTRKMIAQIRADDRVYGDTTIYTRSETKQGLSRPIEWTDVYLKRGTDAPVNVSRCDGVDCGQPALSPDGHTLVFVRATN